MCRQRYPSTPSRSRRPPPRLRQDSGVPVREAQKAPGLDRLHAATPVACRPPSAGISLAAPARPRCLPSGRLGDLKQPGASDLVKDLVRSADVLVEGFRPGVMEHLGLGPDDLQAVNRGCFTRA